MSIAVEPATTADDGAIRSLLRREPVPGRIAIRYEREPVFSLGCRVTGENPHVLLARETTTGEVVGVACRSEREVFVNGSVERLGYLGQLRIDRRYRGRWLVARGFTRLREIHASSPVRGYLAAIVDDNREAAGVLVERRRGAFPAFHPVAGLRTLAIALRRGRRVATKRGVALEPPQLNDLGRIAAFLAEHGGRRQFFPSWTEPRLRELSGPLGLGCEDFRIAVRHGRIEGVMAVWDQSAYKQLVVDRYSGWLRLAAPAYNLGAPLVGRRPLPGPGQAVRSAYASFVCVKDDDADVFGALLAAARDEAWRRELDVLLIGLDRQDPLLPVALAYPHVEYRSTLYLAEWPGEHELHRRLDGRPVYVDIATL